MKLNKKMILTSIVVLLMLLCTSTVHAAIQSSGGTAASYNVDTWIKGIRQMESIGGGFGRSETIDDNLMSSSGSNNIDVHMEKNTEYGAMAILSASSYGNPTKIEDGQTTTGNETGIVMKINKEWVAANPWNDSTGSTIIKKIDNKYKDYYKEGETYVAKKGDAITETSGWHGSGSSTWFSGRYWHEACILRGYSGSIFSYYAYGGWSYPEQSEACAYKMVHPTRCVVIVGEGI